MPQRWSLPGARPLHEGAAGRRLGGSLI